MATKKKPTAQAHTNPTNKKKAPGDDAGRALNRIVALLRPLSPEKRTQVMRSVASFYQGRSAQQSSGLILPES